MDEDGSFEAFEVQNPKLQEELEEEDEDDEDDDDEDDDDDDDEEEEEDEGEEEEEEEERFSELQSSVASVGVEFGESQYETLAVPSSIPFSESDHFADFAASSSEFLTGFPVNSASELLGSAEFKEQVAASHQEVLVGVIVHDAENQIPNQVRSSKLSPTSVTQSILSAPSQITPEQILSVLPKGNNEIVPEADHQNSSEVKTISAVPIVKTPSADGYNWRKYGQKQVKSPKGARSYYKCTNSECSSKKIECSDHLGVAIEIVYKGRHNHEPPRKVNVNSTKEGRVASSAGPDVRNSLIAHPVKLLNDPDSSSKEAIQDVSSIPDRKRQNASDTDGNAEIKVEEEQFVEPESKRRLKSSPSYPGSVLKVVKKSKLVVHAAGDVGISSDGYRWRKYGQKMVKGNPHPRNYYRCTSAGCSVRKHIERAVDNASALIITYKGVHDHDMPVPKKRHGPPSAHLVAAAAPVSMNNLQFKNSDALQSQISPTQWSVDTAGELKGKTFDIGGEKSMESARTLLSVGFEIKPC